MQEFEDKLADAIAATQKAIYRQSGPMEGIAKVSLEFEIQIDNGRIAVIKAVVPCRLIDDSDKIEFSLN